MIEKRTVFILGAGASCPYQFPTAKGLRREIISEFMDRYAHYLEGAGGGFRYKRAEEGYPGKEAVRDFLGHFDHSSTESIDLFLSRNPRFRKLGKMAICYSLLYSEKYSRFREDVQDSSQDWYFYLYNRLTRRLVDEDGHGDFSHAPIAFVTFNYDRSLEYFLFDSLLHSFQGASTETVTTQIKGIPIIHVYGQVAGLEWQEMQGKLEFASQLNDLWRVDLMSLIDNLYVVREERTNPQLDKAREEISKADRIFFLGFGYAQENLEAIGIPDVLKPIQGIYGTALGLTEKETGEIRDSFAQGLGQTEKNRYDRSKQVRIVGCDCVALLREFL